MRLAALRLALFALLLRSEGGDFVQAQSLLFETFVFRIDTFENSTFLSESTMYRRTTR
jgi:hypothetical protein